jgi:dCMP deaminase
MVEKWDGYFLKVARLTAEELSKDQWTKVGSVAVRDRVILSTGYNGFPRGISDSPERLSNREVKNQLTVHAETNCVYNAGRIGASLEGATMYTFGLPTCRDCALALMQAGVRRVVACHEVPVPEKWQESTELALALLQEAGVETTNYPKHWLG